MSTQTISKPRRLQCNCCGNSTTGRQWWNRDTGYGICPSCVQLWDSKGEDTVRSCGARGVHYDIGGVQEIRRLPLSDDGGALLVCYGCWAHEIVYRRERNRELADGRKFDLPGWSDLEIYATVPADQVCDNCDGEHCIA